MSFLLHILGVDNVSGMWYGFWSGFGSDLGEVAIVGGLISLIRKHNCHARWCWRIGRHEVPGTPHVVCFKHSTYYGTKAPTHAQIIQDHEQAN